MNGRILTVDFFLIQTYFLQNISFSILAFAGNKKFKYNINDFSPLQIILTVHHNVC